MSTQHIPVQVQRNEISTQVEEMNQKHTTATGTNTSLVLGVNTRGEIVQFNHTCEQLTGYTRTQVLYKKIDECLIPKDYQNQWKNIFNVLLQTKKHDEFTLPIRLKNNTSIPVKWSNLPIETKQNTIKNICFIGTIPHPNKQTTATQKHTALPKKILSDPLHKIVHIKEEITPKPSKKVQIRKKQKRTSPKPESARKSFPKQKQYQKQVLDLEKKYLQLTEKLNELEKKDRKLERKNKILEKNIQHLKHQQSPTFPLKKKNSETSNQKNISSLTPLKSRGIIQKLLDPFGLKTKKTTLYTQLQQLEKRKQHLDEIEKKLAQKQYTLNKKIQDFSLWKEKLLTLEKEIERRRSVLVEQEKKYRNNTSLPSSELSQNDRQNDNESTISGEETKEEIDPIELLEELQDSAAILQRGILKRINDSFSTLLGFEEQEILDKSLVDFIAPEGLDGIETYYFHRLKGNDSAEYETVFTTKNDEKISVSVSTNPVIYNGEKAIIARFIKNDEKNFEE